MSIQKDIKSQQSGEDIEPLQESEGYIVVDEKKCQACVACMLACSLVHEGVESLSKSRIQVVHNPLGRWPNDLKIEQCRQCVDAPCVRACPEHALTVNAAYGGVRMIDSEKCNGCGKCLRACPYTPSMLMTFDVTNSEGKKRKKMMKCDLCADTPFWDEAGGPKGKKACMEVCPVGAIAFVEKPPSREGDSGYKVNLRGEPWARLGYPTD